MSHALDFVFHPKSVAIVGASDNINSFGYNFILFLTPCGLATGFSRSPPTGLMPCGAESVFTRHMLNYGFKGKIYPINGQARTPCALGTGMNCLP